MTLVVLGVRLVVEAVEEQLDVCEILKLAMKVSYDPGGSVLN